MRKTISLCCIAKNEEKNIRNLTESVKGCFDHMYLTDTGSTDNTVELAKELGWEVSHFPWIEDFAAARNFNFSQAQTDFIMWLDLDDVLSDKDAFIKWRDDAMSFADYWMATYDYAIDHEKKPVVSFARERVIKRGNGFEWKYFIHEGLISSKPQQAQYAVTWKVIHQRTPDDMAKDKGRNLAIFEKNIAKLKLDGKTLPSRLLFYYGKELFEAQKPMEAYGPLLEASIAKDSEPHDKIMAIQYAALSSMQCQQWEKAVAVAHSGIQLDVQRSELWVTCGDALVKMNRFADAIPYYSAAMKCSPNGKPGDKYAGAAFNFKDSYTKYPRNQLIRCYFTLGQLDMAEELAKETYELFPNDETMAMINELANVRKLSHPSEKNLKDTEDIVITCPPNGMYEWDEEIYKTKGMGGSETAAIEMAKHLKKLTGRPVKVFNNRKEKLVSESGVEYLPAQEIPHYMAEFKPKMHIAWRHNFKTTPAKTYLWCHDLITPTVESVQNFEKIICLSPFHSRYLQAMQGLKPEQIFVSRNGIEPERFKTKREKNPLKIVFPSSPDRGLDRTIKILDKVREKFPVELHVFYGFDNLRKSGPQMTALADHLEGEIKKRDWIKFHGFTEQKALTDHFKEAVIWLHPANFIETFCITALEMTCAGVYPISRTLGALQDTLKDANDQGMCHLFEEDAITDEEIKRWADKVCEVLESKAWEKVSVDPEKYSWESVAREWVKEMNL